MCVHLQSSRQLSFKSVVFDVKSAHKLYLHNYFIPTSKEGRIRIDEGKDRLTQFKRRAETSESFELNQLTVVRYTSYPNEKEESSRVSSK